MARPSPVAVAAHPLPFRLLPTQPTDWDPSSVQPAINVRLDGCIVPSEAAPEGARISYSHLVVLDEFISDETRQQLLDYLIGPAETANTQGSQRADAESLGRGAATPNATPGSDSVAAAVAAWGGTESSGADPVAQGRPAACSGLALPADRWERATADMAGGAATWGVRPHVLMQLTTGHLPALREVHARLCKLYPECDIAHLPSDAIQCRQEQEQPGWHQGQQQQEQQGQRHGQQQREQLWDQCSEQRTGQGPEAASQVQQEGREAEGPTPKRPRPAAAAGAAALPPGGAALGREQLGEGSSGGAPVDCAAFVANAAVEGDSFRYHVDADPSSFPDASPWVAAYGDYCNGEPDKPLLVSLMIYLNPAWERDWGGETLFLDGQTEAGACVRPRPRRAVLFDQDVLHRVCAPSAAAGGRPRFSLVWKLALLPRTPGLALCLARPEWGPPTSLGSAARVDAVKRQLAAERRRAP